MKLSQFLRVLVVSVSVSIVAAQDQSDADSTGPAEHAATVVVTYENHDTPVSSFGFSRDGTEIVSVSSRELHRWEIATGKELQRIAMENDQITALRIGANDGVTIASPRTIDRAEAGVVVRSAGTAEEMISIPRGDKESLPSEGYGCYINGLAISPDGGRLVTCATSWNPGGPHGGRGTSVRVWNAESGDFVRQIGEVMDYYPRYTKAGVVKASGAASKLRHGLSASGRSEAMTLSADGALLALGTIGAGGELPEPGEIWIWKVHDGQRVRSLQMEPTTQSSTHYEVTAVALSHDNRLLAAAVGLREYFARKRPQLKPEIRVWDIKSGRLVHQATGPKGLVAKLAFSPSGKWLASAGTDGRVRLWNAADGTEVVALPLAFRQVSSIAFSADDRLLAVGGGEKKIGGVKVWSVANL